MLDSILFLARDAFVYGELLKGTRNSDASERKKCAFFADIRNHIPVLKFRSNAFWGPSVYGPDCFEKSTSGKSDEPIFRQDVPIRDLLDRNENTKSRNIGFTYKLEDLADPILFNELKGLISKLTRSEIAWLATHRTWRHTLECVLYDLELWRFHMERIFKRAPSLLVYYSRNGIDLFLEEEIDQAAKDIKQVLLKIRNRDRLRSKLKKKLELLAEFYPVALDISETIDKPQCIGESIVWKSEARRALTTTLRLYLSELGLVSDKRSKKRPIEHYIDSLERLLNRLDINGILLSGRLRKALREKDHRNVMEEIHSIFQFLRMPKEFDVWTEKNFEGITLDMWLKEK